MESATFDSLISWLIFLPVAGGLLLFLANFRDQTLYRGYGLAVSIGVFFLSLLLFTRDYAPGQYTFLHSLPWVPDLGLTYVVGVDGISLYLILLTCIVFPVAFLCMKEITAHAREYVALMLLLQGAIIGVFTALDLVLFYVFWEAMLIPSYFLIGMWAEKERFYTAIKFVIYTLVGSLLFLIGIITLGVLHFKATGNLTFNILELRNTPIVGTLEYLLWFCFAAAFFIKTPLFPFHSWLPHAYVNAPMSMVIILSGIMSKTGLYALMRFNFTLFPTVSYDMTGVVLVLAVFGVIYGAWCAIGQDDIKGIAAYSSLSHINFVVLGVFAFNTIGETSAILQMFNHGIVAAGLFFFIALIEQRTGERRLSTIKGLSESAPLFSGIFFLVVLAALGLPGLNSFVGEFLILTGLWTTTAIPFASTIAFLAVISIIFGSIYMLYLYQGTMYEKDAGTFREIPEIRGSELAALLPLCFFIVYIGLAPGSFTDNIKGATDKMINKVHERLADRGSP